MKRKKTSYFIAVIILFFTVSLPACSINPPPPKKKKDGPPKYTSINPLKVPDAVPKAEPLSRLGNRFGKHGNTYVALKKRYHVLPTSRGYRAIGIASWYGTQFHGRKTSNGELYNMFEMTAAHPTLPLPTYAKITNLENGKSIIVKINDRGPFHKNRIIDLSYVAAAKLGILKKGIAKVEVKSIDPRDHPKKALESHPIPIAKGTETNQKAITPLKKAAIPHALSAKTTLAPQPSLKPVTKIYLQMGKFHYRGKAEALLTQIKKLSSMPTFISEQGPSHAPVFQIRVGPFPNNEEAIKLTQKIAQAHLPPPIVIRDHS